MKKFAVIMAGGQGSRFWPRSMDKKPKQFIHLSGEGTMIQNTLQRLLTIFPIEDIYVVVNETYSGLIAEQLPEILCENVIIEPFGRSTAPALGLVYAHLSDKFQAGDIMAAFPSDQVISNLGEFEFSLESATQAAEELNGIVTIGINPTRPEKQFGYVQVNEDKGDLGELYDKGLRYTNTFAEKPDEGTAKRFIESGDFIWNSGIFVMKMDVFADAFNKYLPYHYEQFIGLKNHIGSDEYKDELERLYKMINPISMDYGILEKSDKVFVVKASFNWTDVGNWDELYRISLKDARNNVVEGDVITVETDNCFISSQSTLIGAVGVKDLIIVDVDDALLICKRGSSERVQELVDIMKKKQIKKY